MNLRFIEREGRKILQYIPDNVMTFTADGLVKTCEWQDVPEFKEPEKTITVTEKQFDEAWKIWGIPESAFCLNIKKELGF